MSILSYVLVKSSLNFGELISCLRVHMPPMFLEYPPYKGGAFLLSGTKVVVSWDFGKSILYGDGLES